MPQSLGEILKHSEGKIRMLAHQGVEVVARNSVDYGLTNGLNGGMVPRLPLESRRGVKAFPRSEPDQHLLTAIVRGAKNPHITFGDEVGGPTL
jgi:hypothetical protein